MAGGVKKGQGIALDVHQVIRRPLVTEKGVHASERLNAYTFETVSYTHLTLPTILLV